MTSLTPLPDLRVAQTLPIVDEISPEASVGRFEGKTTKQGTTRGDAPPVFEQPWHAHAVKCLALRMSREETARFCEITVSVLDRAFRAPFFQARLREELARTSTPLTELFNSAGVAAFNKIVAIMDDDKTPKATQLACAKEVIERCLGKAPQTIKHEESVAVGDPVELVAHLKAQNAALRSSLPN